MDTEPAAVLGIRKSGYGNTSFDVLIQWHGLPRSDAKRKHNQNTIAHFPHFNLEDKVKLFGAGNVMDSYNVANPAK